MFSNAGFPTKSLAKIQDTAQTLKKVLQLFQIQPAVPYGLPALRNVKNGNKKCNEHIKSLISTAMFC